MSLFVTRIGIERLDSRFLFSRRISPRQGTAILLILQILHDFTILQYHKSQGVRYSGHVGFVVSTVVLLWSNGECRNFCPADVLCFLFSFCVCLFGLGDLWSPEPEIVSFRNGCLQNLPCGSALFVEPFRENRRHALQFPTAPAADEDTDV